MSELKLLAIETSSPTGSVALAVGEDLVERTISTPREQTDLLLGLVDALLAEAGFSIRDLDALAFGRGPGSFTGSRIAAAVTQGLSFATGCPIVPVSSLAALAQRGFAMADDGRAAGGGGADGSRTTDRAEPAATRALCCVDARMGEVYSASFTFRDALACLEIEEMIGPPAQVVLPARAAAPAAAYLALGDGFAAYPQALAAVIADAVGVWPELVPRAQDLVPLAAAEARAGRFVPLEAALPVYLRETGAWRRNDGRT